MLRLYCQRPPGGRCYQGISSRTTLKAAHIFLVLGDPSLNLTLGEESGLGESRSLGSKTLHQKDQKLALLRLGKSLCRSLDLEEGGHTFNTYNGLNGKSSSSTYNKGIGRGDLNGGALIPGPVSGIQDVMGGNDSQLDGEI